MNIDKSIKPAARLNGSTPKIVCLREFGFQAPENLRLKDTEHGGISGSNNGTFSIPSLDQSFGSRRHLLVKAELAGVWRGAAVRAMKNANGRLVLKTPSFAEMQQIRQMFWLPECQVIQMMPSEIDGLNPLELCLWQFIPELAKGHGSWLTIPPFEIFDL